MFKKLIILLLTFIWPRCYANITPDNDKSEKYLVYNGYIPEPEADVYTKFMVSIAHLGLFDLNDEDEFGKGHICAGIIIGQSTILTAAHCIFGMEVKKLHIIAGSPVRIAKTYSTQIVGIKETVLHPLYVNKSTSSHDIGLIYLNDTLKEYEGKVMIYRDLPHHECDLKPGTNCTLVGWGRVGKEGLKSIEVRYIDLMVLEKQVCDEKMYAYEQSFCASESKGGPGGGCKGDSGGPIFCDGTLSGIVARGLNCSAVNPTYFTNVCEHMNWIRENSIDYIDYRSSSSGRKLHNTIYFQILSIILFFLFE